MTAERFRRLWATADTAEALRAQRLGEAERFGRLTGLLLIASMHKGKAGR